MIEDLRRRLDQSDTDRRQALDRLAAAQERITALLTDQRAAPTPQPDPLLPAKRSGWLWRRRQTYDRQQRGRRTAGRSLCGGGPRNLPQRPRPSARTVPTPASAQVSTSRHGTRVIRC